MRDEIRPTPRLCAKGRSTLSDLGKRTSGRSRGADEDRHVAVGVPVLVHELVRHGRSRRRRRRCERQGSILPSTTRSVDGRAASRRWRSASPGSASAASRGSAGRRRRCSRWCRRRSRPCRRCRRRRSRSGWCPGRGARRRCGGCGARRARPRSPCRRRGSRAVAFVMRLVVRASRAGGPSGRTSCG